MAVQIQWRRDTASNWTSANPVLAAGEVGFESDTNKFKVGNGASLWSALTYFAGEGGGGGGGGVPTGGTVGQILGKTGPADFAVGWVADATGGGGVTDGDKGDIVVSGAGSTWTLDAAVVTAAARTLLDDASTTVMRATLGLGNVDNTSDAVKNSASATLSGKTIALGSNTVTGTLAQFNTAITDAEVPAALNGVTAIWSGTQVQYDAIGTKSPTTVYFIT